MATSSAQLSPLPIHLEAGSPDEHFVEMYTDMVYRQFDNEQPLAGGRQLRFDFLRPSANYPTPLVIFIKGGAFRNVHKSRYLPQLIGLAKKGAAVASIEYRTTNECSFPGPLHDVKAAVRYFRAHAKDFNLNPEAIAAWGNSAGGTLATLLGATNGDLLYEGRGENAAESSKIAAVVDWYGVSDALSMRDVEKTVSPTSLLLGEPIVPESAAVQWFSPDTYIGPETPPFLIMHGDADTVVPYQQSELLAAALARHGVPATFYRITGAGHSFEQFSTQTPALEITTDFLLAQLAIAGQEKVGVEAT